LGGHADGDENFLHVALKEANEELGLNSIKPIKEDIVSIDIQPCASHIKREKFVNSHLHINVTFLFEADENEKPHIKDDENSDIKWFSLEDAVSISTQPEMKPIYRKLNDRLRNF
jgi:8-oxo-dGTP pyrophosphatase MutT (NUDIX family)